MHAASARPAATTAAGRRLKLLIAGGSVLLGVCYLMVTALQTSTVYYLTVGELLAREERAVGQTVRLAGEVVDGSIERDRQHLRFMLSDGTATLPVTHTGLVPDLFGYRSEGAYQEVVVEGRYAASGVFEARNIIVRHGPAFESAESVASR